jgi:hypothetical protein
MFSKNRFSKSLFVFRNIVFCLWPWRSHVRSGREVMRERRKLEFSHLAENLFSASQELTDAALIRLPAHLIGYVKPKMFLFASSEEV